VILIRESTKDVKY